MEDNDALAAFKAALDTTTGAANPEIKQKIKFLTSKVKPSSTVFSFGNKGAAPPPKDTTVAAKADRGGPRQGVC